MRKFTHEVREKNGVKIVDFAGAIDLYQADAVRDILIKLTEKSGTRVVANLKSVEYIDSSGIGAFINSLASIRKNSGELVILNATGAIKHIFELTKLMTFFVFYSDEDEAVRSIS